MKMKAKWSKTLKLSKKEFKAVVETGYFGSFWSCGIYPSEKKRRKNERVNYS